jgi:hypothetical protein
MGAAELARLVHCFERGRLLALQAPGYDAAPAVIAAELDKRAIALATKFVRPKA